MPYLCIDRHNHKYYKPINPYCKGVRGNWGNVFLGGADACRLIVVQRAGEAEKILICMRLCAWQMEFFSVSLWNEKVSYNFN